MAIQTPSKDAQCTNLSRSQRRAGIACSPCAWKALCFDCPILHKSTGPSVPLKSMLEITPGTLQPMPSIFVCYLQASADHTGLTLFVHALTNSACDYICRLCTISAHGKAAHESANLQTPLRAHLAATRWVSTTCTRALILQAQQLSY